MSNYSGSIPDTLRAPDWRDSAACRTADPELFFPNAGERGKTAEAKEVCVTCPVRLACLTAAMTEEGGCGHDNRHGIRGGLTGRARRSLYERNRDARSRKAGTTKAVA